MNCEEECYLVLAPWGQPFYWSNVTYTIGNVKLESCSPLPVLLLHIASERGSSIKRVYLMGLDSVVDVPEPESKTNSHQVKSICRSVFLECRGRCKPPSNWSSYTELAEYAEEL
ncbi:MAG: hypothetical protein QXX12_07190 [Nanopusillaceae archaeon]